ncbi:MAG TPA: protein kinase [Actinomycetota bacterium]|nr:protein kinase [Actinomycetota bacterium]
MNGKVVADRYRLGDLLGRGGMATVYSATDTVLERPVAVKVLDGKFSGDAEFVERFRREARASAALNHPNIVSVFDTGSDDGMHFIVMELVPGRTLASHLAEKGTLPPERAAAIASSVARALEAAHAQQLVHRDIKPGNVLLTDEGQVKVTDFGIARAASGTSITLTGAVLGTASYLSPEQAQGREVDGRSDIYSLGCVLYEMLTGKPPFSGPSPVAVATQHVSEEPDPPSAIQGELPPALERVVMRAMAKDPSDRFTTAAEMVAALDGAVTGEVTQGLPAVAGDEPTQALYRPERTAVLPVAAGASPARDRTWVPWVLAALGLGLLGFLLGRSLLGTDPASVVSPPSVAASPTAAPQTTVPPQDPLPTVAEAHQALVATIEEAVAADGIDPGAAEQIGARIDEAVARHLEGRPEEATQKLVEAQQLLNAAGVEGAVIDTWEAQISEGIATLSRAMQADPVPAAPAEDRGEGNSKGKGEGKGKGKGEDDGDD